MPGPVGMQEVFIEHLPLPGGDDVQVILAICVRYLLIEEVMVGVPDQPAVGTCVACSTAGLVIRNRPSRSLA